MTLPDWSQFHPYILRLESDGLVTRTFRRLDPERQQAVLQAILDEAGEHGPADLSIKRVAARAGAAVGSLYQYFPDRDGMLNFAVEMSVRSTLAAFDEYAPLLAAMPLREALSAYLLGGLEWSRLQTGLVRLFARAAYHGDPALAEKLVRPIATKLRQMVHGILAAAAERGEIRPEINLEAAARTVNALLIVTGDAILLPYLNTYFQAVDTGSSPEQAITAAVEMIVRGIGL